MQFKKVFITLFIVLILSLQVIIRAGSLSPILFQLIFNKNIDLRTTKDERINFALLGIAGGKHEGPNLSDTIIFASIDLKESKITLVSIPRDLWITELDAKINSAYAFGESKRDGGGLILAKSIVSKVTGQPVDYAVVIDFSGFIKAVDLMGGLSIEIERTFDDYEYPIAGRGDDPCGHLPEELESLATASSQLEVFPCRYEHLHFDKGVIHMDGDTALKYVRSRHGEGEEGTDFARSQRQEKVIRAFMEKAFSLQILVNPTKLIGFRDILSESINTDIAQNELDDFIKLAGRFQNANVESVIIDVGDSDEERGGFLTHPPITSEYNFEWVLIPRTGKNNFSEIREFIRCKFVQVDCIVSEIL